MAKSNPLSRVRSDPLILAVNNSKGFVGYQVIFNGPKDSEEDQVIETVKNGRELDLILKGWYLGSR